MSCPKKLGKNTRQEFKFTRCTNNLVINVTSGIDFVLDLLKKERMLADLTELHQFISESRECISLAINVVRSGCRKLRSKREPTSLHDPRD